MILWVLFYPQLTFCFSPYPTLNALHVPVLWVQSFPPADFSPPPALCLFLHKVFLLSMILSPIHMQFQPIPNPKCMTCTCSLSSIISSCRFFTSAWTLSLSFFTMFISEVSFSVCLVSFWFSCFSWFDRSRILQQMSTLVQTTLSMNRQLLCQIIIPQKLDLQCQAKDEVSSDSLLTKLGIQDLDVVLRTSRMRWFGHVERSTGWIAEVRKLNVVAQKRSGRPRKSWDEVLENDRKKIGMDSADPQDRSEWRGRLRERLVKKPNPR